MQQRGSMFLQFGDRGVAESGKETVRPASGAPAGRDISLRYQRARIEEADKRDYAAARPGKHECICMIALRAHCTKDRARSCLPATL